MNKPFVIGIAGGSGSGKTFFLKCFLNHFQEHEIALISQDDYYKAKTEQPVDKNGWINFDLPECIDSRQLYDDLQTLLAGGIVYKKEYTFNVAEKEARLLTIPSAPIIVIEGLFIFHYPDISRLLDMKIFLDAREEICLKRRIKRDAEERAYSEEMVMYQWTNHVLPAYQNYLLPYKGQAEKVISNNEHGAEAIIKITEDLSFELREKFLT